LSDAAPNSLLSGMRRAETRLRGYGIRRGVRDAQPRHDGL
jgi:hypothetical protein